MQRCLDDGICLGMNGADTMPIHHEMTYLITMSLPGGGAVEPCGKDAFFTHHAALGGNGLGPGNPQTPGCEAGGGGRI